MFSKITMYGFSMLFAFVAWSTIPALAYTLSVNEYLSFAMLLLIASAMLTSFDYWWERAENV